MKIIFPKETIQEICKRYEEKHTTTEIGNWLKVSPETIKRVLCGCGIKIRSRGTIPKWSIESDMSKKIISMYQSGLSLRKVAFEIESYPSLVRNHLIKVNIPRRPRGGPNNKGNKKSRRRLMK